MESHYPSYAWELYDVETDRGETKNVAAQNHDIVSQLSQKYFEWAQKTGVVDFGELESKEPITMKKFRESKLQDVVRGGF